MYRTPERIIEGNEGSLQRYILSRSSLVFFLLFANAILYRLFYASDKGVAISSILAMMFLYTGILTAMACWLLPLKKGK